MPPKTRTRRPLPPPPQRLVSDVVGAIATFLPAATECQLPLMLVNAVWFRGVAEQDGMKPKPHVAWPLIAIKRRQPAAVKLHKAEEHHVVALIEACPHISTVQVSCCAPTLCVRLTRLRHLVGLHILDCAITDAMLRQIFSLSNLAALTLRGCYDDGSLRPIDVLDGVSNLTNLTHLDVSWCASIEDFALEHISQLSHLKHLKLGGQISIPDDSLRHLLTLKNLVSLDISCCESLTSESLNTIAELENLTCLESCGNCSSFYAGLKYLSTGNAATLSMLDVSSQLAARKGGLKHLKLPHLQMLRVGDIPEKNAKCLEVVAKNNDALLHIQSGDEWDLPLLSLQLEKMGFDKAFARSWYLKIPDPSVKELINASFASDADVVMQNLPLLCTLSTNSSVEQLEMLETSGCIATVKKILYNNLTSDNDLSLCLLILKNVLHSECEYEHKHEAANEIIKIASCFLDHPTRFVRCEAFSLLERLANRCSRMEVFINDRVFPSLLRHVSSKDHDASWWACKVISRATSHHSGWSHDIAQFLLDAKAAEILCDAATTNKYTVHLVEEALRTVVHLFLADEHAFKVPVQPYFMAIDVLQDRFCYNDEIVMMSERVVSYLKDPTVVIRPFRHMA